MANKQTRQGTARKKTVAAQCIQSFSDLPEEKHLRFLGLVTRNSKAGGVLHGKLWDFSMELEAWKVQGGPLIETTVLLVFRRLSRSQLDAVMEGLDELTLISFTAQRPNGKLNPKHYPQHVRLELESISVSRTQDRDMRKLQAAQIENNEAEDPVFGKITYDEFWKKFYVVKTHRGSEISVAFSATNKDELEVLLRGAGTLWRNRASWFSAWREHVFTNCFEMAGQHWVEDRSLTRKEFLKQLGWPCSITFFRYEDSVAFQLQGNNNRIFKDPGVYVTGDSIDRFDPGVSFQG